MKKEDLNKIIKNKKVTHCYIKKGSYYRPNSCGYTDFKHRAGVYTKEDALKHYEYCKELILIPIDNTEHNGMILKEINELSTRLIY